MIVSLCKICYFIEKPFFFFVLFLVETKILLFRMLKHLLYHIHMYDLFLGSLPVPVLAAVFPGDFPLGTQLIQPEGSKRVCF